MHRAAVDATVTPAEYNAAEIAAGRVTVDDITTLVKHWQASHHPLEVDGKAGPNTVKSIRASARPAPFLHNPLPKLPDGRTAVITSAFKTHNPTRPDHDGVDLFYPWRPGDKPDRVVDGGAAGRNPDGTPRWGVPDGTCAISAAPGVVQLADFTATGYRVWIDHGNGFRSGYFHLRDCRVLVGQRLMVGHPLGLVGDNPADHDARHLHFELSSVDSYAPIDPKQYMILAS